MPTPKAGYFLKDGVTKVPGTTTICSAYKDSGGLIHWAWQQGTQGLDYRETRDKAGDKGTDIHAQIEARLKEDGLLPWPGLTHIRVVEQEIQLVSEMFRYGATPDAIGEDDQGRLVLLDWKTSKGIYGNYQLQLAAYIQAWNENHPGLEITGGAYIVHFSKTGEFIQALPYDVPEIPDCPSLADAWAQFLDARRMWDRDFEFDEKGKVGPGKLGRDLEKAKSCLKPL